MIFLYGGGFTEGANALPDYSGVHFVAAQKYIIFVSIKYETLSDLKAENSAHKIIAIESIYSAFQIPQQSKPRTQDFLIKDLQSSGFAIISMLLEVTRLE